MIKHKPFVTFIVMAYKAEKFIQEAIDGAFAQTYDNMEIIFSDDASPDKTFDIILENVKNYNGIHKGRITVNRNDNNIGIGAHLNKLWFEMAKGDWIVVSAGDDISLPHRVERLMEFAKKDVGLIHSQPIFIDENSVELSHKNNYENVLNIFSKNSIEETIRNSVCVWGVTMCLNKEMLQKFGLFNPDVVNEDVILAYRAQKFGKLIYLTEALMKYRRHQTSVSHDYSVKNYDDYVRKINQTSKNSIAIYNQIIKDNNILHLSKHFLKELEVKNIYYRMQLFIYGKGKFSPVFFSNIFFYKIFLKKVFLPWYLLLKNRCPNFIKGVKRISEEKK